MRLTHHKLNDPNPLMWAYDPQRTYDNGKPMIKPNGFWLSVDGDWQRWMDDEEIDWCSKDPVEFTLLAPGRVLTLDCAEDIDQFTKQYVDQHNEHRVVIDWQPLTEHFAGIMIAPCIWERRLAPHTMWYYGWDAASACVWDLSVISLIKELS